MMRLAVWIVCLAGVNVAIADLAQQATDDDVVYQHGAVAADHVLASQAGVEMLKSGGNAVDAAVATSFCLSVVRPYSCGIGGGGFMLIYIPGDDEQPPQHIALNYREMAPAAVGPEYYVNLDDEQASRFGVHAVGVPGTVAGLLYALEHYGTLDRQTVLEPAIRAARDGVAVDANHLAACEHLARMFAEHPHRKELAGSIWTNLCQRGELNIGDVITQPAKARALELIAAQGAPAFYQNEIAMAIHQLMDHHHGSLQLRDLVQYELHKLVPLHGRFGQYDVLAMPPPSSGGMAMLQMLGIIDHHRQTAEHELEHNSVAYTHLLSEAMQHAFADRAEFLADPLYAPVPTDRLLDASYIQTLAKKVQSSGPLQDRFDYGSVTPAHAEPVPDGGTSHFSVIDSSGMAVACTETVNLFFGSLVMVEEFGIVLNNEMDDFTTMPGQPNAFGLQQSDRNVPEPGKRPLSSMSPTIFVRDGRAVMVAGGSGGPRIITGTLQVMLNAAMFDMTPQQAVTQPRFHHQWMPNVIEFETRWRDARVQRTLAEMGHIIGQRDDVGVVQIITVDETGIRAASDPRKGGEPAGY
jgi:gamma-glutamyltranspeptidase/glutathione hydrolase